MPEEATTVTTANTSDGDGKNTEAATTGAGTQTASTSEAAKPDITQTPEFKAALTAAMEKKLPQLKRQLAKELTGEKDGQPSVEEIQRRADEAESSLRTYRAKDQLEDFISDKRNAITVKNPKAVFKYIKDDLEYDDEGKVTNFKDVLSRAKAEAPELFIPVTGSVNAGAGGHSAVGVDMNRELRRAAGRPTS